MSWRASRRQPKKLDADIIVRVSSDALFIDAGFVDHLIATLIEQDGDYVLLWKKARRPPMSGWIPSAAVRWIG